jgi:hypothetical protein
MEQSLYSSGMKLKLKLKKVTTREQL